MAEDLNHVISKMKKDKTYPVLFNRVFGSPGISSQRILKALAQFTASLVSADSRYDKMKRGEVHFNQYEQKGYEIFQRSAVAVIGNRYFRFQLSKHRHRDRWHVKGLRACASPVERKIR
jgi:cytochrome c peroxidase